MSKAFQSIVPNVTAGERTRSVRQSTIYKNLVAESNAPNKPGSQSNRNYVITSSNSDTSGGLVSAHSYEALLDVTKGKYHVNPILAGGGSGTNPLWDATFTIANNTSLPVVDVSFSTSNQTLPGGFTSNYWYYNIYAVWDNAIAITDASNNNGRNLKSWLGGVTFPANSPPMDTMAPGTDASGWSFYQYPGFIVDPLNQRFMNCSQKAAKSSATLSLDYRWTPEYWRIAQADTLFGYSTTSRITLNMQPTELTAGGAPKTAPIPSYERSRTAMFNICDVSSGVYFAYHEIASSPSFDASNAASEQLNVYCFPPSAPPGVNEMPNPYPSYSLDPASTGRQKNPPPST
jgi:hypothetical protein